MALLNGADSVLLGLSQADKVYLGPTLVWQRGGEVDPLLAPTGLSGVYTEPALVAPSDLQGEYT